MQMDHKEYVELKVQLESDFNSIYRRIDDCEDLVKDETNKIEKLQASFSKLAIEQTKTNTRLGIVIALLSAIGTAILAVCVKMLFS